MYSRKKALREGRLQPALTGGLDDEAEVFFKHPYQALGFRA